MCILRHVFCHFHNPCTFTLKPRFSSFKYGNGSGLSCFSWVQPRQGQAKTQNPGHLLRYILARGQTLYPRFGGSWLNCLQVSADVAHTNGSNASGVTCSDLWIHLVGEMARLWPRHHRGDVLMTILIPNFEVT